MPEKIISNIINPLFGLLIGIAIVVFFWGAVEFVSGADDPAKRDDGRRHLLWGIVGLSIIFGVYGIMNFIQGTLLQLFG